VGHYLAKVLKSWIECEFRFQLFFLLSRKIQSFNKLSSSLFLRFRCGNERWKLIVADLLARRQLNHIENRLLPLNVRVEDDQFRLGILSLNDFSDEYLVPFNHCADHRCECALVFGSPHWQDDVDTRHEVVARHLRLLGET
jgi:hypothetical protein